MFGSIKRIIFHIFNFRRYKPRPDAIIEEQWNADFSKSDNRRHEPAAIHAGSRFDIKSESSYAAYLQNRSLCLGLKKSNCIAWIAAPEHRYQDQVIDARFRLDAMGGYAAAGLLFRAVDDDTYYSALVSSKGYFRLDAVRNNMPLPLIGWTELPAASAGAAHTVPADTAASNETAISLTVIAYGSHLVILINGSWAAEINESSIPTGTLGFVLASYEAGPVFEAAQSETKTEPGAGVYAAQGERIAARAFLDALSVNTRIADVEAAYHQWEDSAGTPQARFALAETFAAMGEGAPALVQLKKAWVPGCKRTQRELLLAGRLALQLKLYTEAEEYADACLALGRESPEGREAITEKAKILYAGKKIEALRDYAAEAAALCNDDPVLHTLLGHAYWDLADYEKAAAAYDRSFELDGENGLSAKNAANVYEVLDRKTEALDRYLRSGRVFLRAENYQDLGALVPRLLFLGGNNWEAHALAGKWAFGIEDWSMANVEFTKAEKLRKALEPASAPDPALSFLRALLLIRSGKRRKALPLLEEAVALAPDYGLFHFRLAETRFLLNGKANDPETRTHLDVALSLLSNDDSNTVNKDSDTHKGWVHNFAAQIALSSGDLDAAEKHLEKAAASLGEVPAILVNRAFYHYLWGSLEEALKILEADKAEDEDGLLANCAGNLLVRAGEFERADEYYVKALSAAPDNIEFLTNRASCLIELGYYGEADTVLAHAHNQDPSPAVLELITYVAVKKGEFIRAESACRAALEIDGDHLPSLLNLGWIYSSTGRWDKVRETLTRLDAMDLDEEAAARRSELQQKLEDSVTRLIPCASCDRSWRVLRDPPAVPPLRLLAMPPDEVPAGSCPECGKTYCIGCAKQHLDKDGRFVCPGCGRTLKLVNEGLKKIVADWAAGAASEVADLNAEKPKGKSGQP
jgi:tetratricopeptide (TPR) repeat protein